MKKILFFLSILFLCFSCKKGNPIVFSKQSELSSVTLSLDTSGTFDYKATSKVGADFHETGTFTIEDSLLILRFTYKSYDHLCYEIPLPNDTTLIMKYDDTYVLFPTIKDIPEFNVHYASNADLMHNVIETYKRKDFGKQVGSRYFVQSSGDMSLIFEGDWNISPYYDEMIEMKPVVHY